VQLCAPIDVADDHGAHGGYFHYSFTEVISLVCSVTKGHCVYREMYGAKIVHPVSENYHDFHMENIYHYSFY
jgi:hypothetical protein